MPPEVSGRPFIEELPVLLEKRGLTLRALAREVGGFDHAYLSRMLSGKAPIKVQHVTRISTYLGLRPDHFPEVREEAVVGAVRRDPELRDEIYFRRLGRRGKR